MSGLLFGTAGIPISTNPPGTIEGLKRVKELGLDGMEIEFVRGIYLSETQAPKVKSAASALGLELSCHAPYFINLNAKEASKRNMSYGILHKAARAAALAGARSIVFHPAYYMGAPPDEVHTRIKDYMAGLLGKLDADKLNIILRPELSGKTIQFGTLPEILRLCQELPRVSPTIDFAHWHAMTGHYNSYEEFAEVLKQIESSLGGAALHNLHLHISGIDYGKGGEKKHLPLRESDMNYQALLHALKDYKAAGMVICESPNIEEDALLLKETYMALN